MAVCNFIIAIAGVSVKMMKLMGFCVFHLHVFSLHFLLVLGVVVRGPFVQISMVYLLDKGSCFDSSYKLVSQFYFCVHHSIFNDTGQHTAPPLVVRFFIWGSFNACGAIFVFSQFMKLRG